MSVKQMLGYWAEEGILHRDDEMVILKGVRGPEEYNYFVRLEKADVELEVVLRTRRNELLTDKTEKLFEEKLIETMQEIQPGLINKDAPDREWKNRKKK